MIEDVIIIDDAISKEKQFELEELCQSLSFPWIYSPGTIKNSDIKKYNLAISDLSINTPQMCSELYVDQAIANPLCLAFVPVISAIPFTIDTLVKVKINLTLPAAGVTEDMYGMPHTDFPNVPNNVTAIYYVNDSDGDTIIFNELQGQPGPLTVKTKITPKQGRLVVFGGNRTHAGTNPTTNSPRIVANINFIPYLKD